MAWEYSNKTKQLFHDAMMHKPGTHLGEIENPDGVGEDGSIVCGDAMKLFFKVKRDEENPLNDKIIEIKYLTFGCTSAIASSEALCAMIEARNLTPIESLSITNQDIVDYLDGLPDQKIHCSVMGAEALQEAVKDWAKKRDVDLTKYLDADQIHEDDEGRIVCACFNLTEPFLRRKIKELNLKDVDSVINATKAGGACGACIDKPGGINDLLREMWGVTSEEVAKELDTCNFEEQIKKVIEERVRPALKLHGGDITIVAIKGVKVYCDLEGACSGCSGATYTLKNIVEKELKEHVNEKINVIDI